jgi:PPOX class F420-dependent enzyme/OxyR family protein
VLPGASPASPGARRGRRAAALVALAAGTLLLGAFVARAMRIRRPLLDLRLYASRTFTAASVTLFSLGAAMFGGMILMPLYFQIVRGQDVIVTGLLLIPSGLGALISNRLAAPMTDRAMVIRGLGIGLCLVPAMTAAYRALPPGKIADDTPQLNVLQRVGAAIGTAVFTVVLERQLHHSATPSSQASAFGTACTWVLAVTALATAPTLFLFRAERRAAAQPYPPSLNEEGTSPMPLTDTEMTYLASQRLGRLATVDARGAPQNNPVSFRYNPELGTIDIGGRAMGASRKFRNLAANPNVAFVVDDIVSFQPWKVRCVEIRGHAEALTSQSPPMPGFSSEIIRIHPTRVLSFGLEDDTP